MSEIKTSSAPGPQISQTAGGFTIPNITLGDVEAAIQRKKRRKFYTMFPDEGPLRRELYVPHMEFLRATKTYTECAFIAGNRCITPWTYIGSNNQPSLVTLCGSNFDVQSWDGEKLNSVQGEGAFLKNISQAFRLVMDNGQFLDCTDEHRLLTSEGYLEVRQLMSRANGLRLKRKHEDYRASCVADGYLCDLQLQSSVNSVRVLIPELDDAQIRDQTIHWRLDEVAHKSSHTQHDPKHAPHSTQDDFQRHVGLFSQFLQGFSATPVLQLSDCILKFQQSVSELGLHASFAQFPDDSQTVERHFHQNQFHSFEQSLSAICKEYSIPQQSVSVVSLGFEVEELHQDSFYKEIFYPLSHTPLMGGRRIVAVVPIGYQPIIDFTVPKYANYFAGGVISHNTGKSETVTYAGTAFMMGDYPGWWDGRIFRGPVNIIAAGETAKLVRDSLQEKFLGPPSAIGTGMIPFDNIVERRAKSGIPDAVDTVRVRHKYGGESTIRFMSYDQGREAFQATAQDVIILDEEPPEDIYMECKTRLMTTGGLLMAAFTPLRGITGIVQSFMPGLGKDHV